MTRPTVVIPVHNRRATTLRCLERLQTSGVFDWAQVVVVDDGSTDGTSEAVRARFPAVRLLPGDGNLWWGGAIRLGMDLAHREGAPCTLWLNDDCLPEPGTLRLLADHVARTGHLATGWARTPSGEHYGATRKTSRGLRPVDVPPPGEIAPCDAAAGNCVAIPRAVVERLGLPDAARLPHSLLDADYLLDATEHGFQLDLLGSAACRNDDNLGQASSSWLLSDASPLLKWKEFLSHRSTYAYAANFHFHCKHWGWWGLVLFARGYVRLAVICLLRCVVPLRVLRAVYADRSVAYRRVTRRGPQSTESGAGTAPSNRA